MEKHPSNFNLIESQIYLLFHIHKLSCRLLFITTLFYCNWVVMTIKVHTHSLQVTLRHTSCFKLSQDCLENQGKKREIFVQQNVNFLRTCPGSIISRTQLWTFVNKNQARQLEGCDWLTGSRVGTPPELCCQAKWDTPDFYDILIAINLQLRRSNETQLCNKDFWDFCVCQNKERAENKISVLHCLCNHAKWGVYCYVSAAKILSTFLWKELKFFPCEQQV